MSVSSQSLRPFLSVSMHQGRTSLHWSRRSHFPTCRRPDSDIVNLSVFQAGQFSHRIVAYIHIHAVLPTAKETASHANVTGAARALVESMSRSTASAPSPMPQRPRAALQRKDKIANGKIRETRMHLLILRQRRQEHDGFVADAERFSQCWPCATHGPSGGAVFARQPCHPIPPLRDVGQWLCAVPFRVVCPYQAFIRVAKEADLT
jgi:hypothetical protein